MENKTEKTWIEQEIEAKEQTTNYEKKPSLKLEENQIVDVEIDFSQAFPKWSGTTRSGKQITKAIIPVVWNGLKANFWLNVKNPIYREILTLGKNGQTKFTIQQQGKLETTKYVLLKKMEVKQNGT